MLVLAAGIFGLLTGVGVSASAWDGSILTDGAAVLYLIGPAVFAVGWLGGLLFPRILGSAANGLLLGSLPASVLALVTGHGSATLPLLLLTVCAFITANGLRYRDDAMRRLA